MEAHKIQKIVDSQVESVVIKCGSYVYNLVISYYIIIFIANKMSTTIK